MSSRIRYASLLFVVLGALTGWLATGLVPPALRSAFLEKQEFHLSRTADQALEITEAKWFFLPHLYGDFDLQFDVELAAGTELDVLLRQVEPRRDGEQLLPFHGRFTNLRVSTLREGPGFRTREQALLGPRDGGVQVEPGYKSTVWIEARGRNLKANVAGKPLPWFTAVDEYGMVTLLVRGGKAVLHRFDLTPRGLGSAWVWSRPVWAVLGGCLALLLLLAVRSTAFWPSVLWLGWLPPLWAWLIARRIDTQLGLPEPASMLCLLLASLALVLLRAKGFAKLLLVAFVLGAAWFCTYLVQRDDRAIDAVFGPQAGSQLSEAMGLRVRGPNGLHDIDRPGARVFLLGGQLLYDRTLHGGKPGDHLELVLMRELRNRLQQPVNLPCLPTVDGHAAQQLGLFTRFFADYRPRVLVLGIGEFENMQDPTTGAPRSSRAQLQATLAAMRAYCEQHACKPVLWCERRLDAELLAVLRDAEQQGTPLVVAAVDDDAATIGKNLAAAIAPLLQGP